MLLRYFGETDHRNCGQCDVCLSGRATDELPANLLDELKEQIITLTEEHPLHTGRYSRPPSHQPRYIDPNHTVPRRRR